MDVHFSAYGAGIDGEYVSKQMAVKAADGKKNIHVLRRMVGILHNPRRKIM